MELFAFALGVLIHRTREKGRQSPFLIVFCLYLQPSTNCRVFLLPRRHRVKERAVTRRRINRGRSRTSAEADRYLIPDPFLLCSAAVKKRYAVRGSSQGKATPSHTPTQTRTPLSTKQQDRGKGDAAKQKRGRLQNHASLPRRFLRTIWNMGTGPSCQFVPLAFLWR